MELRPYQQQTVNSMYAWMRDNRGGNPCIVLPTGAGKSVVIADICRDSIGRWPETHILMLTHQKELIVQNLQKLLTVWPQAPVGVFSASLRKRQIDAQILFAGIQSVRNRAEEIGHRDIVLIDECHLISHKDEGAYRSLISELRTYNPRLRVVGLTATPWRLGHGLITEDGALFDALIEPVTITELIDGGYLAPLRSRVTEMKQDVKGVHKRGGEFIESELQHAIDNDENNFAAVREAMSYADERKSWLFFCAGVDHAEHVRDALRLHGVSAECVTGETPQAERDAMLAAFKAGEITAMTNANVLTTGFDHPGIDLIAMMRPTMSPVLYMQMAGRGMRPSPGKKDCLVLDFAENVSRHGPVTCVTPPKKKGEGTGEAPIKVCKECGEIVHISVMVCPNCGAPFPVKEKAALALDTEADIMGEGIDKSVSTWVWRTHTSKASGKEMVKVIYYAGLVGTAVTEYFSVTHEGYAGYRARRNLMSIADKAGCPLEGTEGLSAICAQMNQGKPPSSIKVRANGKFSEVIGRTW